MRILIIGGGIAGLAMARALRQVGLDGEIVERSAAPRRDRLRFLSPTVRRAVMRVAGHRIFRAHYHPLLDPP